MLEVKFKKIMELNGHEFFYYNEFADFLSSNFNFSLRMIKNGSLFDIIKECDDYLYITLKDAVTNFKYDENILTYIIYKLSTTTKYQTKTHLFKTTYEIAVEMKRTFPHVNEEIMLLLKDNLLSTIALEEYKFTSNLSHKRTYEFMLHVEENSQYIYSYYYFFILHASSADALPFLINNVSFANLEELSSYIYTNQRNIKNIINEIKHNDYVLALIASKTNINSLTIAYNSDNYLDMLCMMHEISSYDFRAMLVKKMSYWLLDNYQNYNYESHKAKKLKDEYSLIIKKDDMSFLEAFSQVKILEELYKSFIKLYKSDRIVERKNSISPINEEFHLGYVYNDDYVCSKYLVDNDLVDVNIYSEEYILAQEKQIVNNDINDEITKLGNTETLLVNYYGLFDSQRFKIVICRFIIMNILLLPIIIGLIFTNLMRISDIEKILLYVLGIPAILLLITSLFFTFPEFNKSRDILHRRSKCRKYLKKLNKIKFDVAKMQYYKEVTVENEEVNNSIVKEKINLKCFKNIDKFYNKAMKINKKEAVMNIQNKTILNKVAITVAFLPAISLINHLVFNIIDVRIYYLVLKDLPLLYLIPFGLNTLFITKKKFSLISLIIFVLTIIITIIVNFY